VPGESEDERLRTSGDSYCARYQIREVVVVPLHKVACDGLYIVVLARPFREALKGIILDERLRVIIGHGVVAVKEAERQHSITALFSTARASLAPTVRRRRRRVVDDCPFPFNASRFAWRNAPNAATDNLLLAAWHPRSRR
jgi:hypothetical protein